MLVHKAAEQQQTLPPTRQWRRKRMCGWATGGATVVSRLFEGQLSYVMVCLHCEHRAHSTQAFTILSLPIPRDARSCSIQVAHATGTALLPTSTAPRLIPTCCTWAAARLSSAGLPVAVLQADGPQRRRAGVVFRVQAEERNPCPHRSGSASRHRRAAPQTVGNSAALAMNLLALLYKSNALLLILVLHRYSYQYRVLAQILYTSIGYQYQYSIPVSGIDNNTRYQYWVSVYTSIRHQYRYSIPVLGTATDTKKKWPY